jgi:hypothetical protein
MTQKLNCWQFKNCGREKDGLLVETLGECPVSTTLKFDGMNEGRGAGRMCWMVPDSACRQEPAKLGLFYRCHTCDFYRRVLFEQEENMACKFDTVLV